DRCVVRSLFQIRYAQEQPSAHVLLEADINLVCQRNEKRPDNRGQNGQSYEGHRQESRYEEKRRCQDPRSSKESNKKIAQKENGEEENRRQKEKINQEEGIGYPATQ